MSLEKLKEGQQKLSHLLQNFDWDQTQEGVNRESRARILVLGLPGAGKSTLLNQICGWTVSAPTEEGSPAGESIEDFGLFCLVNLPSESVESGGMGLVTGWQPVYQGESLGQNGWDTHGWGVDIPGSDISLAGLDPLSLAEGADLLVYVLDGAVGVRPADYRWVGRLRRLSVPLLVVLNKSDLLADDPDLIARKAEAENRLATSVLPISALTGSNVADELLPKIMRTCPDLSVALGRELQPFRSQAARRMIARTAWLNGLVALEPVPLIDLPIQIMTLTGLLMRIAAVYDRPPSGMRRREVVLAVAGSLAGRYGAQQLAKLIPVVGWAVSGLVGWSSTWVLGQTAIAYFEAGGDAAIDRNWGRTKGGVGRVRQAVGQRWQRRPRLSLPGRWKQQKSTPVEPEE